MKYIVLASYLLFALISCDNNSNSRKFEKIDVSSIEVVEIRTGLYDTVSVRLSDKQVAQFVDYINNTKGVELRKAFPQYWIVVKFNPDSVKLYKVRNDRIGDGDSYIQIADSTYFKNIYENNIKTTSIISLE